MQGKTLFIVTFAAGLALGAFAHYKLTQPPASATEQRWQVTYTEEMTHKRMLEFQRALEELKNESIAKDVETLSKRIEAQRAIDDLIVKYREAEYAKLAPFVGGAGALLAAILSMIVTWHVAKRSPQGAPDR